MSMVAKAIDLLVTSYSYSIKTGSYFKATKTEKTSSGVPNASSPRSRTDISTNRIDGKSIRHEPTTRVDSELLNRPTFLSSGSDSDSEKNANFRPLKTDSTSLQLGHGKVNLAVAGSSTAEVQSSSFKHQLSGPSANNSEQQDSQLSSPAISPNEMHRFIFAPVEEMLGDPSYLVSIIVEFLHRYVNL